MEAHGTGLQHAYDRVKRELYLQTDRGQVLRGITMACRKGGTLSVLGVYGSIDTFPVGVLGTEGLTLRAAQQHGQAYLPRRLEHARRGELDPFHLATHRVSPEDGPRGDAMCKHKTDGCVRAVFAP